MKTRPTSARARESIFSRLSVRVDLRGIRVLDIFAGSGSLGIEALSRGAAHVTFVDSSRASIAAIAANLTRLKMDRRATLRPFDVHRALVGLAQAGDRFDLAFIDAPYKHDVSAKVLDLIGGSRLLRNCGWVVVEQSRRAPGPPEAPPGMARITVATVGDHRIAFYQSEPQRRGGTEEAF